MPSPSAEFDVPGIRPTRHGAERLRERFPGREAEILQRCAAVYAKVREFTGRACFCCRSTRFVAVIAEGWLITVYPAGRGGRPLH